MLRSIRLPSVAPALCLAAVLALTAPGLGGKRQSFDVSESSWVLDTKASGVVVAPGVGTRRQRLASPEMSIALRPDGTLSLDIAADTFDGTWTQTGKRIDIVFDPLLLETFDSRCDAGLGVDCTSSIRVKASASSRKGKARLKFKLAHKFKFRAAGRNFRRTDTFRGTGERELLQ